MNGKNLNDSPVGINDGLPVDMAKLALWRKRLPQPTTFVVTEDDGRKVQEHFRNAVKAGEAGQTLQFDTYNDGSGRRSTTVIDVADVTGVTLEFATIQLAPGIVT